MVLEITRTGLILMDNSMNKVMDCYSNSSINVVINGENDWNSSLFNNNPIWKHQFLFQSIENDILIHSLDATPEHDIIMEASGPSTFSLSFFVHGNGTICVDGAYPVELSAGKAILFASDGFSHGIDIFRKNSRLLVLDIRYSKQILKKLGGISLSRFAASLMDNHSRPDQKIFLIPLTPSVELHPVISNILHCKLAKGQLRDIFIYSKAIEALSIALKIAENGDKGKKFKTLSSNEKHKLDYALKLMVENCAENWSIARLARQVGLNTRRLKEAFRISIGRSVHSHLVDIRIETACQLLLNGYSVTETSFAVGYENLSHFSKVFKNKKHILPSRYVVRKSSSDLH